MFFRFARFVRLVLIVFCLTPATWAAATYTLTDLGILPGFGSSAESGAFAINAQGQVAGMTRGTNIGVFPQHPFLWTPTTPNGTEGGLVDLATGDYASPRQSFATGINSHGQVAGESTFGGGSFLWTPTSPNGTAGTIIDLGDLPDADIGGGANDINSKGQVVGLGYAVTDARAYLWSPTTSNGTSGSMIDLGVLPEYSSYSYANGINSFGQVVGKSSSNDANRAFLWTPDSPNGQTGSMIDLGVLNDEYVGAEAFKINDIGQVVGITYPSPGVITAFLWNPTTVNGSVGSMVDLGSLPGTVGPSFAYSINSLGQVVGKIDVDAGSGFFDENYHAFLWSPMTPNGTDGVMVDLNSLLDPVESAGWTIFSAEGINDRGQIATLAIYDPDGPQGTAPVTRGVLLTPFIPEPSSLLLLAFGVAIAGSAPNCIATRRRVT